MPERVYSEREIAALLERAVERQEQAQKPVPPEAGLTLAELEKLGQEVGIAPMHLRAAAAELEAGGGGSRQASRTATHVHVERWLPGRLDLDAWEDTVADFQSRHGTNWAGAYGQSGGGYQQIGRTHEWSHTNALGIETHVAVSERGDRVRLRLSQKLGHARSEVEAPLYGGLLTLLLGLLPSAILFSGQPAFIVAFTLLVFVLLSGLVYVADKAWRRKKHRALEALADDLGARLVVPPAPAVLAEGAPEPAARPLLDLDALPEPAPKAVPSPARRTRA